VIVPGGFSYGDYLRVGAIARFSPLMESVIAFADQGGPVLGICKRLPGPVRGAPAPGRAAAEHVAALRLPPGSTSTVVGDSAWTQNGATLSIPVKAHDRPLLRTRPRSHAGRLPLRRRPEPQRLQDDIAGVRNEAGNVVGPDAAS